MFKTRAAVLPESPLDLIWYRVKCTALHQFQSGVHWLLVSTNAGFVAIYEVGDAGVKQLFYLRVCGGEKCGEPVRAVDFPPDFFSTEDDETVRFASGDDEHCVYEWFLKRSVDGLLSLSSKSLFVGHSDYVRSVQYHPHNSAILLSASDDMTCRIWCTKSRQTLFTLQSHQHYVMRASFLFPVLERSQQKGDHSAVSMEPLSSKTATFFVVSASLDKNFKIWMNDKCITTVAGHKQGLNWLTVSPSQSYLATVADDCQLKLWYCENPSRVTLIDDVEVGQLNVTCCKFLSDCDILTCSEDGSVRLFRMTIESALCAASLALEPLVELSMKSCFDSVCRCWHISATNKFVAVSKDCGMALLKAEVSPVSETHHDAAHPTFARMEYSKDVLCQRRIVEKRAKTNLSDLFVAFPNSLYSEETQRASWSWDHKRLIVCFCVAATTFAGLLFLALVPLMSQFFQGVFIGLFLCCIHFIFCRVHCLHQVQLDLPGRCDKSTLLKVEHVSRPYIRLMFLSKLPLTERVEIDLSNTQPFVGWGCVNCTTGIQRLFIVSEVVRRGQPVLLYSVQRWPCLLSGQLMASQELRTCPALFRNYFTELRLNASSLLEGF